MAKVDLIYVMNVRINWKNSSAETKECLSRHMSGYIEEKAKEIRHNEMDATSVLATLSFDKIFSSIPIAYAQSVKHGKWGLYNLLSKWY